MKRVTTTQRQEPEERDRKGPSDSGRERVSRAAYELFSREGVRAVGVDAVIARAGTAKMTLYRNFPSKDDLILDFLRRREQLWTREWLEAESRRRGEYPRLYQRACRSGGHTRRRRLRAEVAHLDEGLDHGRT